MKLLTVFYANAWFAEEVTYVRSGSGFYRETKSLEVPQTREGVEKFAAENGYKIEWRGPIPAEQPAS